MFVLKAIVSNNAGNAKEVLLQMSASEDEAAVIETLQKQPGGLDTLGRVFGQVLARVVQRQQTVIPGQESGQLGPIPAEERVNTIDPKPGVFFGCKPRFHPVNTQVG